MHEWGIVSVIFAVVAAVFGFTNIAATLAGPAKLLFYIFLALAFFFFARSSRAKKKYIGNGLIMDIE